MCDDIRRTDPAHTIGTDQEEDSLSDRVKLGIGLAAIVIGLATVIVGSWLVHATEAPVVDDLGAEMYSLIPRGWLWVTIAQNIALGGVLLAMAGTALAFVYDRPLTWMRATLGAGLFTGLMVIVFGVIPNQMLTLAQGPLEWTSSRTLLTIPPALVLGNELTITYETIKDMIVGGYAFTNLIVVAAVMVLWQNYYKNKRDKPKPQRVSEYGRPIRMER
ncbi:MAG: hypothetical protein BMS9Abin07_0338 [Acidimicrobiia bacterium]|nr:MAG: hypothetical protein BMS9Abin07_0338 [Acidimicrobiia bacterium]